MDSRPLRVEQVMSDMGFKRTPRCVHRISALVYEAYSRAHGRDPTPKIYYAPDGTPESVSCYTEEDRDLITAVIAEHGESADQTKINSAG